MTFASPSTVEQVTHIPPTPPRPDDAHKGTFGTLLVLGGSTEMIGAPMLAARSAYRAGCGLVRVAMPQSVLAAALSTLPEAVGLGLDGGDDVRRFREAMDKADAVVVGPGLGLEPAGGWLLEAVFTGNQPAVVDADGLNLLAKMDEWPEDFLAPAVMTPHPGEMKRLLKFLPGWDDVPSDDAGRIKLAGEASETFGRVVVLKGHRTVVADGWRYFVNATGDNSLAKAGSGDVLSGLIGSLLAQGMRPFEAAVCGVHYHGLAGEAAGRDLGRRGVLSHDVADRLPGVMQ